MAYVIEEECVSCGLCVEACPEHCITEADATFAVHADRCTDCGDCVPACPIDCIVGVAVGGAYGR